MWGDQRRSHEYIKAPTVLVSSWGKDWQPGRCRVQIPPLEEYGPPRASLLEPYDLPLVYTSAVSDPAYDTCI